MAPPTGMMKIGDLAKRADVSQRTIHYYETLGLVEPTRRVGRGYRYYDELALKRLEKIKQLQKVGLSLDEIRQVIELYFQDSTGIQGKREVLRILQAHLAETDRKIAELQSFRDETLKNIAYIEGLIQQVKG
jgi:DNA-binding transcriptional MerR regulator